MTVMLGTDPNDSDGRGWRRPETLADMTDIDENRPAWAPFPEDDPEGWRLGDMDTAEWTHRANQIWTRDEDPDPIESIPRWALWSLGAGLVLVVLSATVVGTFLLS